MCIELWVWDIINVKELDPTESVKALFGVRQFMCEFVDDVEYNRCGVCNIPRIDLNTNIEAFKNRRQ